MKNKNYWLTPPEIYKELDKEFNFDFDPCPFPRPESWDALKMEWGRRNYINPPYSAADCFGVSGMTAFIHKAIIENRKGKLVVMLLPERSHTNLLLMAGAEIRPAGRTPFLEIKTNERCPNPSPTALFILR